MTERRHGHMRDERRDDGWYAVSHMSHTCHQCLVGSLHTGTLVSNATTMTTTMTTLTEDVSNSCQSSGPVGMSEEAKAPCAKATLHGFEKSCHEHVLLKISGNVIAPFVSNQRAAARSVCHHASSVKFSVSPRVICQITWSEVSVSNTTEDATDQEFTLNSYLTYRFSLYDTTMCPDKPTTWQP